MSSNARIALVFAIVLSILSAAFLSTQFRNTLNIWLSAFILVVFLPVMIDLAKKRIKDRTRR
jgi:hypothetical protein